VSLSHSKCVRSAVCTVFDTAPSSVLKLPVDRSATNVPALFQRICPFQCSAKFLHYSKGSLFSSVPVSLLPLDAGWLLTSSQAITSIQSSRLVLSRSGERRSHFGSYVRHRHQHRHRELRSQPCRHLTGCFTCRSRCG
jgi:hypothetical protein